MNEVLMKEMINKHGYTVIGEVGRGGFSVCYLVNTEKYPGQAFVAKVEKVKTTSITNSQEVVFRREVDALLSILHPNVIHFYDYFQENDIQALILEYCPNGTIADILKERRVLKFPEIVHFTNDILKGMVYLHENGYAHQDIKPSNFLIDKYHRVKIADFGLSKKYNQNELSTNFAGTLAYEAPEILQGDPFDPFKADVWAFGVTLYKMTFGIYPFNPTDTSRFREQVRLGLYDLPRSVHPIIAQMINKSLKPISQQRISFKELEALFSQIKVPSISQFSSLSQIETFNFKQQDSRLVPSQLPTLGSTTKLTSGTSLTDSKIFRSPVLRKRANVGRLRSNSTASARLVSSPLSFDVSPLSFDN